jgi:high-affinity Fe2+/Pb2+ permease
MAEGQQEQISLPTQVGGNDLLGGWLSANVGKLVAGVMAPVFAWLSPAVAGLANEVFKLHLSSQQVSNVGIAIIAGLAIMGYKWLHNRGEWERAMLDIQKVYLLGRPSVPGQGAPVTTTGSSPPKT